MTDAAALLSLTSAGLVAFGIVSTAILRGWNGYLAVKRMEMESPGGEPSFTRTVASPEIKELRERVRKLEAIASGVDL